METRGRFNPLDFPNNRYYNARNVLFSTIRAIMIPLLMMPHEMAMYLAEQARAKRLSLNLSQKTVSERSGVSYAVVKKFERTGQISLESLLKVAYILESFEGFKDLFPLPSPQSALSFDELMKDTKRKRGRR